jgi:hypothetical protein
VVSFPPYSLFIPDLCGACLYDMWPITTTTTTVSPHPSPTHSPSLCSSYPYPVAVRREGDERIAEELDQAEEEAHRGEEPMEARLRLGARRAASSSVHQ